MAPWLSRLFGRGAPEKSRNDDRFGTTVAVATPARFSVWDQLAGDPGAAQLRSQWEARWDEF